MNRKSILAVSGIAIVILIGAAIYFVAIKGVFRPASENGNSNGQKINPADITYLISKEKETKFCNGANMDSEGYRKTITMEVDSGIPSAGLTEENLVKKIAVLATDGTCRDVLQNTAFTADNGIVKIAPIEGWAGISIAMCACKPQVEVNLLRVSGITQVVWLGN